MNKGRIGNTLFAVGAMGVVIMGSALDGPGWAFAFKATIASFIIGAIGYLMIETAEEEEETIIEGRKENDSAAKRRNSINTRRDETFRNWLNSGMDNRF